MVRCCPRLTPLWLLVLLLCSGFEWPGAQPRLEYALRHGTLAERADATRRLARQDGAEAEELLLIALEDEAPMVQQVAASALERRQVVRAIPILQDLLRAQEARSRVAAARALAYQLQQLRGDLDAATAAVAALALALADPTPEVRAASARALSQIGDHDRMRREQAPTKRAHDTIAALLDASDAASQRYGVEALAPDARWSARTDENGIDRMRAALGTLLIRRLAALDPSLHGEAINAIAALQTPSALNALISYLRDPKNPVEGRLGACQALPRVGRVLTDREALTTTRRALTQLFATLPTMHSSSSLAVGDELSVDQRLAACGVLGIGVLGEAADLQLVAAQIGHPRLSAASWAALEGAANRALTATADGPTPETAQAPNRASIQAAQRALETALRVALKAAQSSQNGANIAVQRRLPEGSPRSRTALERIAEGLLRLPSAFDLQPLRAELETLRKHVELPGMAAVCARAGDATGLLALTHSAEPARLADRLTALRILQGTIPATVLDTLEPALIALIPQLPVAERSDWLRLLSRFRGAGVPALLLSQLGPGTPDAPDRAATAAALAALTRIGQRHTKAQLTAAEAAPLRAQLRTLATRVESAREVREAAALSLGTWAEPSQAGELAHLLATRPSISLPLLTGLESALPTWPRIGPASYDKALTTALGDLLAAGDPALSHAAAYVLAHYHPPSAAKQLASALQAPDVQRRTTAAAALGLLPAAEARPLLRYLLLHGPAEVRLGAVQGLAETGEERDLASLLKLTRKDHWPTPAAVAFTLRRWLDRSTIRPHVAERALCRLATTDPLVRVNVAAAMAVAGGGPCPTGGLNPLTMLEPQRSGAERLAGAHWLHSAILAGRMPATANERLARCAMTDPAQAVRVACQQVQQPPKRATTDTNPTDTSATETNAARSAIGAADHCGERPRAVQVHDSAGAPLRAATVLAQYPRGGLSPLRTGPSGLLFSPYRCGPPVQVLAVGQLPPEPERSGPR